jgi:holo-[acyl-carrier protein] synthase
LSQPDRAPKAKRAPRLAGAISKSALSLAEIASPHVGVDAVFMPTFERRLKLGGEALLKRIYTEAELRFAAGRLDRLATRLAAKEAVLKALGTGIRGIALREVEIRTDRLGKPVASLLGGAAERAQQLGLSGVAISMSHEEGYAIAIAAGFFEPERDRRSGLHSSGV